jgi:D-glycero-D-manno-heptose 1,7-bisphosphate phosphatase
MRAIFLDKDGTLVEDVPYNVNPELLVLCACVTEGLQLLQQHGYALFVVSNQPGLANGMFSDQDLRYLLQHLDRLLADKNISLQGLYYPNGSVFSYATPCTCRKPMPGLLHRAAGEHGIDLACSWMIGDILNDVEAGRRAGCKTVLIDNGNETEWLRSPLRIPNIIAKDLYTAAKSIVLADRLNSSITKGQTSHE